MTAVCATAEAVPTKTTVLKDELGSTMDADWWRRLPEHLRRRVDPEALLTLEEISKDRCIQVSTIKRWLRAGKFIGHKEGGQWTIRRRDLDYYVRLGLGARYKRHAPAHIRKTLGYAFDRNVEWWKTFRTPGHAFLLLGKLWNCADIIPDDLRESIIEWLGYEEDLSAIDSYAQAARALKKELTRVLGELKQVQTGSFKSRLGQPIGHVL